MVNRSRAEDLEMLTRLLSLNLFEAWLKFNSCPSPNASRCLCECVRVCVCARSSAVGRWVVSSWAQVFSLCLGLTLFMPEGRQELQTTEFFIKVTSWRDVPCSCCFLPRCVPTSYITYPALTCSSLWEELFDPCPDRSIGAVESIWVGYEASDITQHSLNDHQFSIVQDAFTHYRAIVKYCWLNLIAVYFY